MKELEKYSNYCKKLAEGIEPKWRTRLFVEVALTNYQWLEQMRMQEVTLWKHEDDGIKVRTFLDQLSFSRRNFFVVEIILEDIQQIMEFEVKPLTEKDDVDWKSIVFSAEKLLECYRELMDLKTSFKFLCADRDSRGMIEDTYGKIESLCQAFELYYEVLVDAKQQLENIVSEEKSKEQINLDLILDVSFFVSPIKNF